MQLALVICLTNPRDIMLDKKLQNYLPNTSLQDELPEMIPHYDFSVKRP